MMKAWAVFRPATYYPRRKKYSENPSTDRKKQSKKILSPWPSKFFFSFPEALGTSRPIFNLLGVTKVLEKCR